MPTLDDIKVASPCTASWDAMEGDERVRFCGQCRLNVYNLSGMSRDEAKQLVQTTEGRLCVRFHRRADGKLLTEDCPVGWSRARRASRRLIVMLLASAATMLALALGGIVLSAERTRTNRNSWLRQTEPFATFFEWIDPRPPMVMGAICVPPQTTPTENPLPQDAPIESKE